MSCDRYAGLVGVFRRAGILGWLALVLMALGFVGIIAVVVIGVAALGAPPDQLGQYLVRGGILFVVGLALFHGSGFVLYFGVRRKVARSATNVPRGQIWLRFRVALPWLALEYASVIAGIVLLFFFNSRVHRPRGTLLGVGSMIVAWTVTYVTQLESQRALMPDRPPPLLIRGSLATTRIVGVAAGVTAAIVIFGVAFTQPG